jgi:hypothetical protein
MALLKRIILAQTSRSIVGYINLIIRKCYTTKHRGVDTKIDEAIRYITLSEIFGLSIKEMKLEIFDEPLSIEIRQKINESTKLEIQNVKKIYGYLIEAIQKISQHEDDKKTIKSILSQIGIGKLIFANKYFHKEWKINYSYFRAANRVRIEVPIDKIGLILSIATPLIIVGGVFQQYILANEFKFKLEMVFGTSDYIAASISTLVKAIYPLIITLVLGFIATVSDLSIDPISTNRSAKHSRRDLMGIIILATVGLVYLFFTNRTMFNNFFPTYIMIVAIYTIARFVGKYVKNFYTVYTISTFVIIFLVTIYSSTIGYANEIKENKSSIQYNIVGNFEYLGKKDLMYVVSGSKFIVLWDKNTQTTILVKPELISLIKGN